MGKGKRKERNHGGSAHKTFDVNPQDSDKVHAYP